MEPERKTAARRVCAGLFGLYALVMIYLLFLQRQPAPVPYLEYLRGSYNLVPFRTIREQLLQLRGRPVLARFALRNLSGNVVLFVPLGLLLPMLWRRQRQFGMFLATVCGSIALVELLQLFTTLGSLDVDDLILNVLGAGLGYGLWRLWHKIRLAAKNRAGEMQMCHRTRKKPPKGAVERIVHQPPSGTDPNGSYTGKPKDPSEIPVQDADDL